MLPGTSPRTHGDYCVFGGERSRVVLCRAAGGSIHGHLWTGGYWYCSGEAAVNIMTTNVNNMPTTEAKIPRIIRASRKNQPYVMISRTTAQDSTLSWAARGVLAYLLSKPDDW